MAHFHERFLKAQLKNALKFSPLVGILGQRQVGKTTLLENIVGDHYVSFDEEAILKAATLHPKTFLENFTHLTAIDECQKAPQIFPALKLVVQKSKRPGQYILSGSVRFTSRKAIQESLTGRIFNLELLPMTLAEAHHLTFLKYGDFFEKSFPEMIQLMEKRLAKISKQSIQKYLQHGGLPGICFLREESHRFNKLKAHIETLLQRDIQLILKTTASYTALFDLLVYLAEHQGESFSLKECSTKCRLAQNTVKKLLEAYEALFLIRRVPGFGFKTSPTFFLEDQGMAYYLISNKEKHQIDRFLFSQIFSNVHYSYPSKYQIGHYEYKSGSKINLVVKLDDGDIAFIYENSEVLSAKSMKLAKHFLSDHPLGRVILLSDTDRALKLAPNMVTLPLNWII
jgi:predicted AAA+ superfamily ATPase